MQYFIKVKFWRLLAVIGHCRAWIDYKIRKHCLTRFGRYCVLSTNHRELIYFAIKADVSVMSVDCVIIINNNSSSSSDNSFCANIQQNCCSRCIDTSVQNEKGTKSQCQGTVINSAQVIIYWCLIECLNLKFA